jgi:uncharacterized caspase-like protein
LIEVDDILIMKNTTQTKKAATVTKLDLMTLKIATEEHVRFSYLPALRRCVDADLVWFMNEGRGAPVLTDKGRAALLTI